MEHMEDGTTLERRIFAQAEQRRIPIYGVVELLPLCNLSCDMCYVRMSREEMEAKRKTSYTRRMDCSSRGDERCRYIISFADRW